MANTRSSKSNGSKPTRGRSVGSSASSSTRRSTKSAAPKSANSRASQASKTSKPAKKRTSQKRTPQQQAMYRRRRIIALVALLLAIALVVFCVYSLARGAKAVVAELKHDDTYALNREAVPGGDTTASGIRDCAAKDLTLSLKSGRTQAKVGDEIKFTGTIAYSGTNTVGCLLDDSQAVLTITSGDNVIYKSDLCSSDPHQLLLDTGDKQSKELTWNTTSNAALTQCPSDANSLEKVKGGDYQAQLSMKGIANLTSDKVSITITE